jgi:hypothetical protein
MERNSRTLVEFLRREVFAPIRFVKNGTMDVEVGGGSGTGSGHGMEMQACILEYSRVPGGYPVREEAFSDFVVYVASRLGGWCVKAGACNWIAHGVGEPVWMDEHGVYYDRYDVVAHFPRSTRLESCLSGMGLGNPAWECDVVKAVGDGSHLSRWIAEQCAARVLLRCFGTGFAWPGGGSTDREECGAVCGMQIGTGSDYEEYEVGGDAACAGADAELFGIRSREARRKSVSCSVGDTEQWESEMTESGLGSSWWLVEGVEARRVSCSI